MPSRAHGRTIVASTLAVLLGGCGARSCISGGHPSEADAAPPATGTGPAPVSTLVTYGCAGLGPAQACSARPSATDALVHQSERLTELAALHGPPAAEWWKPVREAVDAALAAIPKKKARADAGVREERERVLVQNAALHVALAASEQARDLALRAMNIVHRLAPPPGFHDLTPEAHGLEPWLGPHNDWVERSHGGPLMHEAVAHESRFVRMVLAPTAPGGPLRAVFSQLVAIDAEGVPFLTGVVGHVEIRRGTTPTADACVVLADPSRARCGAPSALAAVEPRDVADLPSNHFLRREGGSLRCNDCHSLAPADAPDEHDATLGLRLTALPEGQETRKALSLRREALFDRLRPKLDTLFRATSE